MRGCLRPCPRRAVTGSASALVLGETLAAAALAAAALAAAACGAAAGEGGGATDLPTRSAGPYGELPEDPDTPLDEPVVLADPDEREAYRAPSAHRTASGLYTVLFAVDREDGLTEIRRAEAVDLRSGAAAVTTVLQPQESWEASRVDHPSLVTPGCAHAWGLLYEGGTGAIGYAGSEDGAQFLRAPQHPVLEATLPEEGGRLGQPAAVWSEGVLHVYYAAPAVGSIFVARVTCEDGFQVEKVDADPRTPEHDPVLGPNPFAETFDVGAVQGPTVRVTRWAQRPVFDLWYGGRGPAGDWAVGFAGSQDGLTFKRFAENPVLPAAGRPKLDPSVVARGVGAVMFFTRLSSRDPAVIAAALHE